MVHGSTPRELLEKALASVGGEPREAWITGTPGALRSAGLINEDKSPVRVEGWVCTPSALSDWNRWWDDGVLCVEVERDGDLGEAFLRVLPEGWSDSMVETFYTLWRTDELDVDEALAMVLALEDGTQVLEASPSA